MNTRSVLLLSVLLAGIAAVTQGPTQAEEPAARKEIQVIYDQYVRSFLAKDVGPLRLWYEQHLAPEVLEISTLNQRKDRAGIMGEIPQAQALWPLAKESSGQIVQITMQGDDAVVWFTHRLLREVPDPRNKPEDPHAPHQMVTLATGRDTWIKQADGWKCPLSVNIAMQVTLDGKPVSVPGVTPPLPGRAGAKAGDLGTEKGAAGSKPPQ